MSISQPLVSVIIVNWNGKKWLKKCLDSLRSQTYKNFEIVFVDNASSDDSIAYVEKNYPEVLIVRSDTNLGFACGNNIGIKKSSGDLLLFLNTDTWVESDFLEELVDLYISNNFVAVGPLEAAYETGLKRKPYTSTIDLFGWPVYRPTNEVGIIESFYLTGVCFLTSKEFYLRSGGLDDDYFMYSEEVDWFWRLQLLGEKCAYTSVAYVYHAGCGSGSKGVQYTTFLWRNQNTLQMLLKNYTWYNLLWVLPIYLIQNIFEFLAFLLLLKPKIAWSYVEGLCFNAMNICKIFRKRKIIQKRRETSDFEIIMKMFFGFGKLYSLFQKVFPNK